MTYDDFFAAATGVARPYAYQRQLAICPAWPATLEVFTGLGKTEATVLAWLFRRLRDPSAESRRLVYALPMRSLVEQTADRVSAMIERLSSAGISGLPTVEILMGGEVGTDWIGDPVSPRILIGTQDMLLSRALNRGYGMSRFQWPMAFAWLNSDVLWVIDEVQLQGVGVTTAAQLQGLREGGKLGAFGSCHTIFVSATMSDEWIDTYDHRLQTRARQELSPDDLMDQRVQKIAEAVKLARRLDTHDESKLADAALSLHRPGTRTIVILNTVDRAVNVYRKIAKLAPQARCTLLHSRFRPDDRARHLTEALGRIGAGGAILVSTQVIEAGIDLTSTTMISDLAPWASIVQRLGRCNRKGLDSDAAFYWVDPPELKIATVRPYGLSDLENARAELLKLEGRSVSPRDLPRLPMRNETGAVLRRVDILELFDTAPDLSGNDIDVSRFIREADDFSVQLLWREEPPGARSAPRRLEFCPAPRSEVEKIIKRLRRSGRGADARTNHVSAEVAARGGEARVNSWTSAPDQLRIGDTVWLAPSVGAYSTESGFDPASLARVAPILVVEDDDARDTEDSTVGGDERTFIGQAVTLAMHAQDAAEEAAALCGRIGTLIGPTNAQLVEVAARWHDAGKAHDVFQETMRRAQAPADGGPWAKGVRSSGIRHSRRHFRHELASALAWLSAHDGEDGADLIAYLVLAHHGKVRISVQPFPGEPIGDPRSVFGICQGDVVSAAQLGNDVKSPAFQADLTLFDVGSRDGMATWSDRVARLIESPSLGIFRLAFLESLVRVADWNASRRRQPAQMLVK